MARLQELINLQRSISHEEKVARCTGTVEVLVEQISKRNEHEYLSRSEHDEMVVFQPVSPVRVGDFVDVELTGMVGSTFTATQH